MATSDSKPTKSEAFKNNIAPPSHGKSETDHKSHQHDEKQQTEKPAEIENPAVEREKAQERQEAQFQAEVKADRKNSPVDALGLPEGEGDELWSNAVEIAARDSLTDDDGEPIKESDKEYQKRVEGAEASLVQGARNFLDPLAGSLRPLGYTLTKTDTHVRLAIVDTEANPDPKRFGGKPNSDGQY